MGTRTLHGHPDFDSSGVCKNQAALRFYHEFYELWTDSRIVNWQVETTPELYYMSLTLTVASVCSTGEAPFPAEQ